MNWTPKKIQEKHTMIRTWGSSAITGGDLMDAFDDIEELREENSRLKAEIRRLTKPPKQEVDHA